MIEFKNYNQNSKDNTPIPHYVWGFLQLLYKLDIIPQTQINAEFMNKYHPELLFEEYKRGYGKNYEELKEYFKELKDSDIK